VSCRATRLARAPEQVADRDIQQHPDDPAAAQPAVLDAVDHDLSRPGFRGCPFGNAAVDYHQETHPARQIARDYREQLRARLRLPAPTPHRRTTTRTPTRRPTRRPHRRRLPKRRPPRPTRPRPQRTRTGPPTHRPPIRTPLAVCWTPTAVTSAKDRAVPGRRRCPALP
jgi:hypothetical protein